MSFVEQRFFISYPVLSFVFLMRQFSISQREAQRWIDKKRVRFIDGRVCRKSEQLFGHVSVLVFEVSASAKNINPLFWTPFFAIFDKPANLLSHPKGYFESPSLMDSIRYHFGKEAVLVHRLDKETSGLVLVALHTHYASKLGKIFMDRAIKKSYWARVEGCVQKSLAITLPIFKPKRGGDLSVRMRVDHRGQESCTLIEPIAYCATTHTTLVRAMPHTGRTHQIRVHLNAIGHRILGDPLYGTKDSHSREYLDTDLDLKTYESYFGAKRLMLHAFKLEFSFEQRHFVITSPSTFDS